MWILRHQKNVTAKRIARELGCRQSYSFVPRRKHFLINYGSTYPYSDMNADIITNKIRAQRILEENNIVMPKIYLRGEEVKDSAFPLLARRATHSRGKDIIYIKNREHLQHVIDEERGRGYKLYDYLVEYINKSSEYRVHILNNPFDKTTYTTMVNVKIKKEENADPIVRNKDNGWAQISYENDFYDSLINLGSKCVKVLGYDFGAVDIIRKKGDLYVLEVNSAPGLEPRKIQVYVNYFKEMYKQWRRGYVRSI